MSAPPGAHLTLDAALVRLPGPEGERHAQLFTHGTLRILVYAPRGHDPQTPHAQDEVYVVMRGRGTFVSGDTHRPIEPGDLLFVPAGAEHRFEAFTEELALWVVFYGPAGGEG